MTDTNQQKKVRMRTNHNVRLVITKNDKTVLCLFEEVQKEGKLMGFRFVYPYFLSLGERNEEGDIPVTYTRWCPYTPIQDFRINPETVTTVTFPDDNILENYVTELESYGITREQIFYEEENGNSSEPVEVGE